MTLIEFKRLLRSHNILHKSSSNPAEVSLNCPTCRDTKFRLQVNPTKILHGVHGWCFCYKGWHAITLKNLLNHYHINSSLIGEVEVSPQTTFELFQQKMANLMTPTEDMGAVKIKPTFDTSKFFPIIPANSWLAKKCLSYLQGRGFGESQIAEAGLMFSNGELINRVIIPCYENGEMVYYQARDITGHAEQKILNPSEAECGIGKSQVMFNLDQAQLYQEVAICEGWASAMSVGPNAVAINGKVASERQIALLKRYWSRYLIMLDHGAEKEAFQLAGALASNGKVAVRVGLLPAGDPNDCTQATLRWVAQTAIDVRSPSEAKLHSIQQRLVC